MLHKCMLSQAQLIIYVYIYVLWLRYHTVCAGFQELVEFDPQLARFQGTVLSRASAALDLGQHTAEENEKLDVEVGSLCHRLVPHFQRKAATAVLELLVRQYRYAPEAVLACLHFEDQSAVSVTGRGGAGCVMVY